MEIYLTGAKSYLEVQPEPKKSNGGYISSSLAPQGLDELMSEISQYTLSNNLQEVYCLAIKNTNNSAVTGIRAWVESSIPPLSYMMIGFQEPVVDSSCDEVYFEDAPDSRTPPPSVIFAPASSQLKSIRLDSLDVGQFIGIWIKRVINQVEAKKLISDEVLAEQCEATSSTAYDRVYKIEEPGSSSYSDTYLTIDTSVSRYIFFFQVQDEETDVPSHLYEESLLIEVGVQDGYSAVQIRDILFDMILTLFNNPIDEAVVISGEDVDSFRITNLEEGRVDTTNTSSISIETIQEGTSTELPTEETHSLVLQWN